jgi:hypothetical protein
MKKKVAVLITTAIAVPAAAGVVLATGPGGQETAMHSGEALIVHYITRAIELATLVGVAYIAYTVRKLAKIKAV